MAAASPFDSRGLPAGYPFKPEYEITAADARAALAHGLLLVDVRTSEELDLARIPAATHIPLNELEKRIDELADNEGPIAFMCHHGVRSMKAALMARALGKPQAMSVAGGIDAWSLAADPSVPRYERGLLGYKVVR